MLRQPERLPDEAPRAVPRHGITRGLHSNGKTDAWMCEAVGFDAQAEEPVIESLAAGIDRIELELAAQAQFGAEAQSSRGGLHGRPRAQRVPIYGTIFLRPFERR